MNPLIRGALNAIAIELAATWIIAALLGYWWPTLAVIAACIAIATTYSAFSDRLDADHDFRRAYRDAHRLLTASDHDIITRAHDDILRRDPQAYPLTKRGVWPADCGGVE